MAWEAGGLRKMWDVSQRLRQNIFPRPYSRRNGAPPAPARHINPRNGAQGWPGALQLGEVYLSPAALHFTKPSISLWYRFTNRLGSREAVTRQPIFQDLPCSQRRVANQIARWFWDKRISRWRSKTVGSWTSMSDEMVVLLQRQDDRRTLSVTWIAFNFYVLKQRYMQQFYTSKQKLGRSPSNWTALNQIGENPIFRKNNKNMWKYQSSVKVNSYCVWNKYAKIWRPINCCLRNFRKIYKEPWVQ